MMRSHVTSESGANCDEVERKILSLSKDRPELRYGTAYTVGVLTDLTTSKYTVLLSTYRPSCAF